jgi:PAS domain S-box-containing protein
MAQQQTVAQLTHEADREGVQDPESTLRAVLNILEDFNVEKARLEETQRATFNILEDFNVEKTKVEKTSEGLKKEVAERKRAEEAVKESEQRLTLALDSAQMGAWELNLTNDTAIRSLKHDQIFGYSSPQPAWGSEIFLSHVVPEDRDLAKKRFEEAFATGCFNMECRIMWPDQSRHWIAAQGLVYRNHKGDPVRMMGVVTETTERKRTEEALRQAHDQLEARVQERTAEILKKTRDLETLLYVTSHDLREPLRSIENFSRMVHDRYAIHLDDKGRDFLRRVIRGAQRMDQLMTDILVLSRAQRMELPAEEVEGESIVREALRQLEEKIKETGATVQVAKDLPRLQGNRTWATQGVYNLIANALKFTRNGEAPEVEIAPYQPTVEDGPVVGIVVRDRGPGVAPEHAERIFQLFQRAVGREVEGTGAGLAIVRQVAERHGGRAWVQPRESGGSEFILTFGATNRSEWKEAP